MDVPAHHSFIKGRHRGGGEAGSEYPHHAWCPGQLPGVMASILAQAVMDYMSLSSTTR